jgi:phosphomannomutase
MTSEIFKAYDIRGIYGKELTKDTAYKIGRAFVDVTGKKNVAVGIDMRKSSEELVSSLIKGITEQGANVTKIGLCSTPMFYFAVNFLKADAGIMVTASHNPGEYNGFKMTLEKATPITYDNGIGKIKEKVASNKFKISKIKGSTSKKDILHEYCNFLLSLAKHIPRLKVVIDTSNGMAGLTVPNVFHNLDMEIIHINKELDGNFPNHEANPLKHEMYDQLIKEVKKHKADFGAMFDGDADRIGFVDEKGNIIGCDIITALIAKTFKNERILYDLRSSWSVKEEIEKAKNIPVISRVGHSYIKKTMRKKDVIFGGELSGHYYYKEHFFTESGILTLIKVAQIIEKEKKKLSEIVKPINRYYQSGEINSEVTDKEKKMKELEKIYKDAKILKLDGITIEYKDFWFNVRPSNTEPLLRLNLEAKTKDLMEQKKKEVLDIIRN